MGLNENFSKSQLFQSEITDTLSLMELGRLYAERCDFSSAEKYYLRALKSQKEENGAENYFKTVSALLRIYAEMDRTSEIEKLKEDLQAFAIQKNVELDSKTYYMLGLCSSYRGQQKLALEYLEKSLAIALANDEKENLCFAIHGIANIYYLLNRYEDALKEIYNLQVFFQVLPLDELKISSQILNSHILRELGKHQHAIDVVSACYAEMREHKNLYLFICLLYAMGKAQFAAGNIDAAKMYLLLAKNTVDPVHLKHSSHKIDRELTKLGLTTTSEVDLIFDLSNKVVVEKKMGKVDFKNQFILLDLLRMFVKTPGEVYSKEAIVEKIWRQNYDPGVHDNKLYVTIKRLRKMIEPDFEKPKYIFRAKNGYFLNKNARVLIQK